MLEQRLGPVSASTLRATDDRGSVKSQASRYVSALWWRTIINIVMILSSHLIHHFSALRPDSEPWSFAGLIAQYLIPFMYGALGADAFLLRETTHRLHVRQFDPRRIPENRCRFLADPNVRRLEHGNECVDRGSPEPSCRDDVPLA